MITIAQLKTAVGLVRDLRDVTETRDELEMASDAKIVVGSRDYDIKRYDYNNLFDLLLAATTARLESIKAELRELGIDPEGR